LFVSAQQSKRRAIGRSLIGTGLLLLALKLLVAASAPLRGSPVAQALFAALNDAPVLGVMIAAVMALLTSSSLVVVLLAASLAGGGFIDPPVALALS
jgi:phosphate:Na+ symporter